MAIGVVAWYSKIAERAGVLAMQSLHVWSHTCVTSLVHAFFALFTHFLLAMATVSFVIT